MKKENLVQLVLKTGVKEGLRPIIEAQIDAIAFELWMFPFCFTTGSYQVTIDGSAYTYTLKGENNELDIIKGEMRVGASYYPLKFKSVAEFDTLNTGIISKSEITMYCIRATDGENFPQVTFDGNASGEIVYYDYYRRPSGNNPIEKFPDTFSGYVINKLLAIFIESPALKETFAGLAEKQLNILRVRYQYMSDITPEHKQMDIEEREAIAYAQTHLD